VRLRVVDATERYVERNGLSRIRIEEIAEEAGCSRATIYRYFADKDELVREVLIRRAQRIASKLSRRLGTIEDPAEMLVEGIARGVEEFRRDPYFESFYGPASAGTTTSIAGGSPAIRAVVAEAMAPLFDLAEATGRLRPGLSRDDLTEWIMLVTTALLVIPQPSLGTRADQERYLRTFLVPAVFTGT
jgi:AcrR family transcriptional regulator